MQNILTIPNVHTFNKSILNIAKAQAWNAKMNWHYKNKHEHQSENQNLDYQKHQPQTSKLQQQHPYQRWKNAQIW